MVGNDIKLMTIPKYTTYIHIYNSIKIKPHSHHLNRSIYNKLLLSLNIIINNSIFAIILLNLVEVQLLQIIKCQHLLFPCVLLRLLHQQLNISLS